MGVVRIEESRGTAEADSDGGEGRDVSIFTIVAELM
jgi:hypothetical protein